MLVSVSGYSLLSTLARLHHLHLQLFSHLPSPLVPVRRHQVDTVISSSMLDASANASWPSFFTANGHWYSLASRMTADMSEVFVGLKTQEGPTEPY